MKEPDYRTSFTHCQRSDCKEYISGWEVWIYKDPLGTESTDSGRVPSCWTEVVGPNWAVCEGCCHFERPSRFVRKDEG